MAAASASPPTAPPAAATGSQHSAQPGRVRAPDVMVNVKPEPAAGHSSEDISLVAADMIRLRTGLMAPSWSALSELMVSLTPQKCARVFEDLSVAPSERPAEISDKVALIVRMLKERAGVPVH